MTADGARAGGAGTGDAAARAGRGDAVREQEAQEITRRFARRERLLGQACLKLALHAQHQLHARQAVEPEVALERAVERHIRLDVRARFTRHGRDYTKQAIGVDLGGKGCDGAHSRASVHS